MERRNRSIEALKRLIYIDSLDAVERAAALVKWHDDYLLKSDIKDFNLELNEFKQLEELFFKNINFLKKHKEDSRLELIRLSKVKKFLQH